jgi:iron complex outermembrane receptor protein
MDRDGAADLWEAVRAVPGVILSGGGRRGDSNFKVRGYGSQDVPIFVDGVLAANPYRGEGDAARFLTGDLESVEIQKGFSSSLLGANTLGGAVLMRTAKPKYPLEIMLRESLGFDGIMRYGDSTTLASAGTKQPLFYGKAMFQYRNVDHFRLSESFEPVPRNPQQQGERLFFGTEDLKLSFMAGLTPLLGLDIWLTYTWQNSDKGVSPPDIRTPETSPDFVLWDWPRWERHSTALNALYEHDLFLVSALFYFDKYDNRLDEYQTITHYEQGIHLPHSDYDEYSLGGRLLAKWNVNNWNTLEAALTYKKEDHKGLRGGYASFPDEDVMREVVHINEDTWSFGAEWAFNLWKPLTFKAGAGFNMLYPVEYWGQENEFSQWIDRGYYVVRTRTMFLYTWQAGIFFDINENHQLRLTYARKNHFPNMSQRYSTRYGKNLPNPSLGPEIAQHFEAGYTGSIFSMLNLNVAVYYSLMNGKIVEVEVPDPERPNYPLDYSRNLDAVSFFGFEPVVTFTPNKYLRANFSASINGYYINNSYDAEIKKLAYYPLLTLNAYAEIKPIPEPLPVWRHLRQLTIIPRVEYIGSRWTTSTGTEELPGYFLLHIKTAVQITRHCTVSLSVENILDAYYEIRYNSPQAGRNFNLTLEGRY